MSEETLSSIDKGVAVAAVALCISAIVQVSTCAELGHIRKELHSISREVDEANRARGKP